MVVILQRLRNGREVQTLKPAHLDDIVLQAPLLGFQRYHVVDVFEQAGDCVCLRAIRLGHVPEHVGGGDTVALDGESEAHVEDVESREVARVVASSSAIANFWRVELGHWLASRSNRALTPHLHRFTPHA
jgi:hypothetical protein